MSIYFGCVRLYTGNCSLQFELVKTFNRCSYFTSVILYGSKFNAFPTELLSPYFLVYILSMNHTFSGIDLKKTLIFLVVISQ